jgi:hypothetical protein
MTAIFRQIPGVTINSDGGTKRLTTQQLLGDSVLACTFCGSPTASGYWNGHDSLVSCCQTCAVQVLPRLAADCLCGERGHLPGTAQTLRRHLVEARAVFWESAAMAMERCAEAARQSQARETA